MMLGKNGLILNNYMSLALVITFVQAASVGLHNVIDGEIRNYASHLFQLFSAAVMIAAGARWSDDFDERFWRRFAVLAIFAASASSLMTLRVWNSGDIGRYYTPAYILLFVVAFSLAVRPNGKHLTVASLLVAIVSNKRGPLISVILMVLAFLCGRRFFSRDYHLTLSKKAVMSFIFMAIAAPIVFNIFSIQNISENNIITRAFEQTTTRLFKIFSDSPEEFDLNAYSAGRIEEIQIGLDSITGLSHLLGNGAGWNTTFSSGKTVQNLHFTPISLAVVFGTPFASFFYFYVVFIIARNLKPCLLSGTVTEKMAIFYLIGSIVHTLTAFSIFIDLLNFFFIGVLVNAGRKRRRVNAAKSTFPNFYNTKQITNA